MKSQWIDDEHISIIIILTILFKHMKSQWNVDEHINNNIFL